MKKIINLFNQAILLRKGYFLVPDGLTVSFDDNREKRAAIFLHTLNSMGYKLDAASTTILTNIAVEDSIKLYNQLSNIAKFSTGKGVNHYILYTDFPNVPSEFEQDIITLIHYLTGAIPEPEYQPKDATAPVVAVKDRVEVQFIGLEEAEKILHDYIQNLLSSPIVWSSQQKIEVLGYFCDPEIDFNSFDLTIPCKENMVLLLSENPKLPIEKFIKTATDLLRFIVAVNKGDITLAEPCRFLSHYFNRKFRKRICTCLENLNSTNALEDMFKYREQWLRVGEKVHPGEFKNSFPRAVSLFTDLRNNAEHYSFNSRLDKYMKAKNINEVVNLLRTRPGEFARKLDWCIRNTENDSIDRMFVCANFYDVADKVSIPVLLQLMTHFKLRGEEKAQRTFFLKNGVKSIENNLEPLNEGAIKIVLEMLERSIKKILSTKEFLSDDARVYIDQKMFEVMLPNSLYMRQASLSAKPLTRGTVLHVDANAQFLRFFTHWRNIPVSNPDYPNWTEDRVDIDTSLLCFDKDGKLLKELSWRSYASTNYATFSGDVTNAPKGASEFIDLDMTKIPSEFAYGLLVNNSYTGQRFCDVPELFSGVMIREKLGDKDTLFDASSVELKADLISDQCDQVVSFLIDFTTRKLHWLDFSSRGGRVAAENGGIFQEAKSALDKCFISVGDYYKWLCESHNIVVVENPDEATFNVGKDVSKYDIEEVMKYM